MDVRELFLDTMRDLRQRTDLRSSEYDVVQAAGLMRRLLLDRHSIVDMANRGPAVPLECSWGRIRVAVPARNGSAWVPMNWLDPLLYDLQLATFPNDEGHDLSPETGSLRDFLDYELILRDGVAVATKELIRHYANREGGVHYDAREADNPLLADIRTVSEEPLRLSLLAVARIVYRAVEPLTVQVYASSLPHPYGLDRSPSSHA